MPVEHPVPQAEAPVSVTDPPALPPIDQLTAESDYSVFVRPSVPVELQREALRKLWVTVPALAPVEVAEAHMADFNAVPTFPEGLRDTIYDAVRGLVERVAEPPVSPEPAQERLTDSQSQPPSAPGDKIEET